MLGRLHFGCGKGVYVNPMFLGPHIHMFLSVFAEVFSKGLLLTGDAAGITKTVFLPLVEGASAAGAVLRPDPAKLGAGITVGAACRAAINIVQFMHMKRCQYGS